MDYLRFASTESGFGLLLTSIHGARSVVYRVINLPDEQCSGLQRWLKGIITRSGVNKAVVALANKNARVAWALVNHKTEYKAM